MLREITSTGVSAKGAMCIVAPALLMTAVSWPNSAAAPKSESTPLGSVRSARHSPHFCAGCLQLVRYRFGCSIIARVAEQQVVPERR